LYILKEEIDMTMLEKLKENDFDLETINEIVGLVFRDLLDEDGKVDKSRVADVGNEIFTDEVNAELATEVDEFIDNTDTESAEGVADATCTCIKVVLDKINNTWLRSKLIEALEMETE
jgi:hypothetical protein